MKINSILLYNFGSYEGETVLIHAQLTMGETSC